VLPRRYTLTHSDATGDLFLTVGAAYDWTALTTWQVRAMADEVVAEWVEGPKLVVHCRAQGGWLLFRTKTRMEMFRGYMPMVLQAMHYGDRAYLEAHPELEAANVEVKWHFRGKRRDECESLGTLGEYAG
jgi:Staygreen protein